MSEKRIYKDVKKNKEVKPKRIVVETSYIGKQTIGEAFLEVIYQDINK